MKRTCSIVTALIMAFTIFIIPNLGISYAAGEDEIVPATTEPGVTDDESASVEAKSLGEISVTVDADSITENSITFKWDAVSEAEGYEWSTDDSEWHSLSAEQTSYTLTDLDSGKEYTLYVRAYKTGESGEREYSKDSAKGTTKSETVEPTAPAAPTNLKATPGLAQISYKWDVVSGAEGYAYSRYGATSTYRDNGNKNTFTWQEPRPENQLFCVKAYVKTGVTKDTPGAVQINPANGNTKIWVLLSNDYASVTAKPKAKEKMTRKKFSKGYYYSYYQLASNGKWVKMGTSSDMWNAVKNAKSKTKYLIALDIKRNNVIVYKGKKGNWKVYKHFVVATGKKGKGTTAQGTFKIFKRKIKFATEAEHSKVGKKYTCWYASRWRGGLFFHSVLYQYNSKKKLHDGDVGCDKSHGCVRMKLGDAKWIYKNCKNGTAVVSSKKWTRDCRYGSWNWNWTVY